MEARFIRPLVGLATVLFLGFNSAAQAQLLRAREHVANSPNFIVFASSPQWAAQVAEVAEQNRRDLAIYWLGEELPAWPERCPIHVQSGPQLLAGGETRFSLLPRGAGAWMMTVQGTPERVLDSVLPHEITHTIFATHFAPTGKYVPRWADEGACTTVEHVSEKSKHAHYLQQFLRTGRGLSFNKMLSLKEYPADILPLYAQGHSAVQFLMDQRGARAFVEFLEAGMQDDAWEKALQDHYAYETLGQFQKMWNQWLTDGSPQDLISYAPVMQGQSSSSLAASSLAASNSIAMSNGRNDTSLDGRVRLAIGNTQPAPASLASLPIQSDGSAPDNSYGAGTLALNDSIGISPLPQDSARAPVEDVASLGNESWYKRRLHEAVADGSRTANARVNGAVLPASTPLPAFLPRETDVSPRTQLSTNANQPSSSLRSQATARPLPAQSAGVQVLDWGNSQPVPGIQAIGVLPPQPSVQMVPIHR